MSDMFKAADEQARRQFDAEQARAKAQATAAEVEWQRRSDAIAQGAVAVDRFLGRMREVQGRGQVRLEFRTGLLLLRKVREGWRVGTAHLDSDYHGPRAVYVSPSGEFYKSLSGRSSDQSGPLVAVDPIARDDGLALVRLNELSTALLQAGARGLGED